MERNAHTHGGGAAACVCEPNAPLALLLPAGLQIKPGLLDLHPDELAIVVHYEVRLGQQDKSQGCATPLVHARGVQYTHAVAQTCTCVFVYVLLELLHARGEGE